MADKILSNVAASEDWAPTQPPYKVADIWQMVFKWIFLTENVPILVQI